MERSRLFVNMMTANNAMRKKAAVGVMTGLATLGDNVWQAFGDVASLGAAYVIAATMMGGAAAGYVGSKITAPGKADLNTVRKGYENERLKADVGYLSSKLQQEARDKKKADVPKSIRAF